MQKPEQIKRKYGRWRPSLAAGWPVLVALLCLPALTLLFRLGLSNGDDNILHVIEVVALDQQWQAGVVYTRWVPELVFGLGYPLFNYYGLAPFYVAELLHRAGAGFDTALALEYAGLIVVSALGMWRLALDIFGALPPARRRWAAVVAAVAYVYAPYLLTNTYVRGAVGELAGQALLPWLLWSLRRIFRAERPQGWAALTGLGVALLAVTHSLTLLFSVPVLLGYTAVLAWRGRPAARRLGWASAAMALAAGLSAFYWLPLIAERQYISPTTFTLAAQAVAASALTLRTLLNTGFFFHYTSVPPFQLGLVQVALGVAGWWLGRRTMAEWGFWAALGLGAVWASSVYALPLWLSTPALAAISFPWRLLGLASLALALATGGLVAAGPAGRWVNLFAPLFIVLIVAVNFPRMPWLKSLDYPQAGAELAELAQYELATGEYGGANNPGGNAPDFLPRWVDPRAIRAWRPAPPQPDAADGRSVSLAAASALELRGTVAGDRPGPLRFASFYFPGWRFYLDDNPLPTYASTDLGLLTVDVPAGAHRFRLVWQGTRLQAWAAGLSLASLAALGAWLWLGQRRRVAGGLALGAFALAGLAVVWPLPAPAPLPPLPGPAISGGVALLGVRAQVAGDHSLYLFPIWYVREASAGWQAHWRLRDGQGRLVAETNAAPWFDSASSAPWPAGTVADDAYRLALPDELPAGNYALEFCLHALSVDEIGCAPEHTHSAGSLNLPNNVPLSPAAPTMQPLDASFGNQVRLAGYQLTQNGTPVRFTQRYLPARAGDVLEYTLNWQALQPLAQNYRGFLNLLDAAGQPLAQQDNPLGTEFFPPRLWGALERERQTYRVIVPATQAGAVYWTTTGVYGRDSQRLPVQNAGGPGSADNSARLAALKVVVPSPAHPAHGLTAQFGDMARLLGYDVSLPAAGLRAGGVLTLTFYYQAQQGSANDLTQFVHVFEGASGLAGQSDAPPSQGLNPTSAWLPGEVVVNRVSVPIGDHARPGRYQVLLGFYDPSAGGLRLPVTDGAGQLLADGQLVVMDVTVDG